MKNRKQKVTTPSIPLVLNVDQKQQPDERIMTRIVRSQLVRSRLEVKQWSDATVSAESVISPNRTELIRLYNNIEIDPHLTAVVTTLKLKIVNSNWSVFTNGEQNDEKNKILNSNWFRKILELWVDSLFYGFSLVQFGDIVNDRMSVENVLREYILPEKRSVRKKLNTQTELISIDDEPYSDWLIFADSGTLGLYHKVTPLVIMKRAVTSAWSEYAEIFGLPMRIGRTDIRDPKKYKNMDDMMSKMGSALYGIFDPSDNIEFVETSKGDAFQVFNEFISRIDQQISKLFLGQTGTTDEKSFAGSAGVHSGILGDIVDSYVKKMIYFVNDEVFPKLVKHGLLNDGDEFDVIGENAVSKTLSAMSPLVANKILEVMTVTEVRALVGLAPDDTIVRPTPGQQQPMNNSVMNAVSELYADFLHNAETKNVR